MVTRLSSTKVRASLNIDLSLANLSSDILQRAVIMLQPHDGIKRCRDPSVCPSVCPMAQLPRL